MLRLFIHQWKEKLRSPFWQKSIWLNIILGILGLYLLLNIVAIGFFADTIIQKIYKSIDLVEVYTGFLFFYFAIDLIIRFLIQQLPILSIQPYLTLPIKKSKLLHYPLIKSISSFFNIVAILLILPFFVKVVCTTKPFLFSLVWIIIVFSLIATNNFLNFSFKKYFSKRPLLILFLLVLFGSLLYLDTINVISFSRHFSNALLYISNTPFLVVIPIIIATLSYYLAYYLLKRNSYIEDPQSSQRRNTDSFSFLTRYGEIGYLLRTEIKLIFRNKRPKSLLYFSLLFLVYGFIFYQKPNIDNDLILIFTGFILTASFGITYGQYLFSWESSFFDSFIANKISPTNYIKSKYLLFAFTSVIGFFVTLPYALISYKIGFINAAMLLYNIGISSVVLIFFCTFNSSRIDLGKSSFMNYQGSGATQFLLIIPLMGIPVIFYLFFKLLGIPQYSYYVLGGIGIIGIIFNKYLLEIVTNQFVKRKYRMALGFRQK